MKSSVKGMHYSYSLIHESEVKRFVVIVFLTPQNPIKIKQIEVGRGFIPDYLVSELQSKNVMKQWVDQMVENIVKTYEDSLKEKSAEGLAAMEDFAAQATFKALAAKELNAELSGYLQGLGFDTATSSFPTGSMEEVLANKAAELLKAQYENRPNTKALALELESMKQSFVKSASVYKQVSIQNSYPKAKPNGAKLQTVFIDPVKVPAVHNPYFDDDDDEDDTPDYEPLPKPKSKKQSIPPLVSLAFADYERKFRND